jgi:hypothetical protein
MSAVLVRRFEQGGVIDVNSICGDLVAPQLENVREWDADHRAIVARVGNLSLACCGRSSIPCAEHSVPAERYRRKERRCGSPDGFVADNHGRIAKPKLRIRSEELNETVRVARVDNCEHPLPPCTVALHDAIECDNVLIHCVQHTPRRGGALIRG